MAAAAEDYSTIKFTANSFSLTRDWTDNPAARVSIQLTSANLDRAAEQAKATRTIPPDIPVTVTLVSCLFNCRSLSHFLKFGSLPRAETLWEQTSSPSTTASSIPRSRSLSSTSSNRSTAMAFPVIAGASSAASSASSTPPVVALGCSIPVSLSPSYLLMVFSAPEHAHTHSDCRRHKELPRSACRREGAVRLHRRSKVHRVRS